MFKVARLPFVLFTIIGSVQLSLSEGVRAQDIDPNILSRVESFVPEPAPGHSSETKRSDRRKACNPRT